MKKRPDRSKRERVTLASSHKIETATLPVNEDKLDKDLLWKEYELNVEFYKHHLDLLLKFNIFYYVSTGAILSFYFSKTEVSLIKYSLLFPIMECIMFGFFFLYGTYVLRLKRQEMFVIIDKLNLISAPTFNALSMFLMVSALLMFGVAGIILWLFLFK